LSLARRGKTAIARASTGSCATRAEALVVLGVRDRLERDAQRFAQVVTASKLRRWSAGTRGKGVAYGVHRSDIY